jgi:hypothetical protein
VNKAKTAKVLSAAAVANMAAAGFMAPPAGASTHVAAGTAGGRAVSTVPSAGRAHPGGTFTPGYRVRLVKKGSATAELAGAAAAPKVRGFVPRAGQDVRPNTETGCSGDVCFGLYGGGSHVSYTNQHFFDNAGCHIGWMSIFSPRGALTRQFTAYSPNGENYHYFCSKQEFSVPRSSISGPWPVGTQFCGHFQNVTGKMCEEVR